METILAVNAGSSSLKFKIFGIEDSRNLRPLIGGKLDGIGVTPRLCARAAGNLNVTQDFAPDEVPDLTAAIRHVEAWLRETQKIRLSAVAHRVVHGGPDFSGPVVVNEDVLHRLEQFIPLAPLHQPHNIAPIRILRDRRPELPQVACFDTAFHRSHSALADRYAIPEHLHAEGVRRYGFHGLSYEYVSQHLSEVAPDIAGGRLIVAHLGSGASMCAIQHGRSVESTFGFTTLDGLPMGTRCGQIDPGVILYLLSEKGMTGTQVRDLLYRECGLIGLSGISNDMRELLESAHPRAAFAIDYFVHRVGLYAGEFAAALGGLDAFVFTAGIGENSAVVRARIVERLAWLGARLDPVANEAGALRISSGESSIPLFVVPTDEELMIARHALDVIASCSGL
ncbi:MULTISPECIES: acetate/propionate family kinase [unclassified Sinorhizobium]|uniref:acetate/propionate family kinase n=1 Tax=unclassified Sinorhizobium TaxID=2613772 RepID=UPI0035254453